jgi:lipoprotein-anchoring transpeptidase ErfK/SrfK
LNPGGSERRQLLWGLGVVAIVIVVAGVTVAVISRSRGSSPVHSSLPAPSDAAFVVRHPAKLQMGEQVAAWAPVRHPVVARRAPRPGAGVVEPVAVRTPEGTGNVVQVLGRRRAAGDLWLDVRLPSGASEQRGWVPRAALGGYGFVHTRLVVDERRLRAVLLRDGRPVFATPVGIGAPGTPTPRGKFYVRNRLTRYASPAYGPIAFGTSARSDQLTDWPAGGFIGIHGTDRPDLLPGRVSHGCIRMRNRAIRRLDRLMPVGTPLTIR